MTSRNGFGKALSDIAQKRNDIVVLSSFAEKTRTHWFAEQHPDAFFHIGHQNAVGIATGMALHGKVPFVTAEHLDFNQLRTACINNANIKIVSTHSAFSEAGEGATHQHFEDIALLRSLPNMTILVPADEQEAHQATVAASVMSGPVYLRMSTNTPYVSNNGRFTVGRAEVLQEGNDCTIVACGRMVSVALRAARKLAHEGIHCTVINNHTIKPLDKHTLLSAAHTTGCMITAEEHQIHGGLGSAVAELLSHHSPTPLKQLGVKDRFGTSGTHKDASSDHGLTREDMITAVRNMVARKTHHATHAPFNLHDGRILTSLRQLYHALETMDDATFAHHVNSKRNDFSTWAQELFHVDLSHCTTRKAFRDALRSYQ